MTKAIRITVTKTAGSAPREAGTQMLVWPDRIEGTIGGGRLEWDAMKGFFPSNFNESLSWENRMSFDLTWP